MQSLNEAEFRNWVYQESKSLNSTAVNSEEKEIQLRALAKNLTPEQNKKLVQISLETEADVNSRILATYLLTQNSSSENKNLLSEIAQKALPDLGPINAHSVAEIKRGQELALRTMAIDELALLARNDDEAFDQLQRLSTEAESAEIRSYVQGKLKELRKQK